MSALGRRLRVWRLDLAAILGHRGQLVGDVVNLGHLLADLGGGLVQAGREGEQLVGSSVISELLHALGNSVRPLVAVGARSAPPTSRRYARSSWIVASAGSHLFAVPVAGQQGGGAVERVGFARQLREVPVRLADATGERLYRSART